MIIKAIVSALTGGRLVLLKDHDGQVTTSIAYKDAWGEVTAKRYWPFDVRTVRLLPGGEVDGGYVKQWKWYREAANEHV